MVATETAEPTQSSGSSSNFKSTIRRETGLIEHICQHGCGHPAYGSVDWMEMVTGDDSWGIHGCCQESCCSKLDWILEDLMQGIEAANSIIIDQHEVIDELIGQLKTISETNKLKTAGDANTPTPTGLWVPK